jgi:hypothetical protein
MTKIYKMLAMLLVVAAVVCVAGCANKAPTAANNTTPAAPAEKNGSAVTPMETPVVAINTTETNTTETITENNTSVVNTENQTGVHLSNAERNRQIIKSHQNNSSVNTSQ